MQNEEKAAVKKRKRKKHPAKILISLLAIRVPCYLIYVASTSVIVMLNLKQEILANNSEINRLSLQKKELSAQREKLRGPEYVKHYAGGEFLVVKKSEQVSKPPGSSGRGTNGEQLYSILSEEQAGFFYASRKESIKRYMIIIP